MSLRSNINLLITLVMIVFVVALTVLEIDGSRRAIREEMEAATKVTVQLLENVIKNERDLDGTISPRALVGFLTHLGRVRAHDIRLDSTVGVPLYESPSSPYKPGKMAPAWFTRLVSPPIEPITLNVGTGKLRILPEPSRSVLDAWDDLLRLFWLSLALFVLVNLIVFWFAGRALDPVKDIVQGLRKMELGEFHARLPKFKVREMGTISDTFNRMAQAVEESFAVKREAEKTALELKENRELTQIIQRHIEEERRNLALELHDELGQSVTAVKSIATSLVNRTREKHPDLQSSAQMIVEVSGQMYDAMHGMVRQLRPLALDKLGLHDALQELVGAQQARFPGVQFELKLEGDFRSIDTDVSIAAYRMVQECLTNIVRHAGATRAEISVSARENLTLTVQDNGNGLPADHAGREERFGLMGMRERAEGLGGTFALHSEDGVRINVSLPKRITEEQT
jgi:two-component system, NarL family, sensor histidine kinase UhpB